MRFTVQPPLVNYTPTTRQWEIQNSLFWTPADWFFPDFLRALLKHGSSYRGSNFIEMIWGETKLLRVSGRFELSRVRVTEGKITVNVWRKSRGNRFWFELARVRVIESQLYITHETITSSRYVMWLPSLDSAIHRINPISAVDKF